MRRKDRAITETTEFDSIFKEANVCRVAFNDDEVPYIVAMNFGYAADRNALYFHCATKGKKIDLLNRNNRVAFQLDCSHRLIPGEQACDFSWEFRSIIGKGRIAIVTDEAERRFGLDCIMQQYSNRKDFEYDLKLLKQTTILKLQILEKTGKKKI